MEGDTVWITAGSLTKDTKTKNKMLGKDEIKTDYNIKIDFKLNELMKAGPSGPDAPKSRWRKKMYALTLRLLSSVLSLPLLFSLVRPSLISKSNLFLFLFFFFF